MYYEILSNACLKVVMKDFILFLISSVLSEYSAIILTKALPITTASLIFPAALAVLGSLIPKPTANGIFVLLYIWSIFSSTSLISNLSLPVTPLSET